MQKPVVRQVPSRCGLGFLFVDLHTVQRVVRGGDELSGLNTPESTREAGNPDQMQVLSIQLERAIDARSRMRDA